MKKKSSIIIGLVSAILTFGALMATVGKPNYLKHFQQCQQTEVKQ